MLLWLIQKKGIEKENLIAHDCVSDGPCPHLLGEKPGKYSCAIHNEPWYKETPCFKHSQIEAKDSSCRMGTYILKNQTG